MISRARTMLLAFIPFVMGVALGIGRLFDPGRQQFEVDQINRLARGRGHHIPLSRYLISHKACKGTKNFR
jgi:hypothetical protein